MLKIARNSPGDEIREREIALVCV